MIQAKSESGGSALIYTYFFELGRPYISRWKLSNGAPFIILVELLGVGEEIEYEWTYVVLPRPK